MNIIGREVRIIGCEAKEHGDNPGCVCHLRGSTQRIEKLYDTPFAGTPTYHLAGMKQRVRLSEVLVACECGSFNRTECSVERALEAAADVLEPGWRDALTESSRQRLMRRTKAAIAAYRKVVDV